MGIDDELDATEELEPEGKKQEDHQGELGPPTLLQSGDGERGTHAGRGEEQADDPEDGSRNTDVGPGDETEQRHGEGVGEGQKRCGGPELADDRMGPDTALRDGHGHEQKPGQRGGRGRR